MTGKLKKGSYMVLFIIVVIAAIIIADLAIGRVLARYRKRGLSTNQIFTLGDTTEDILSKLDKDVTIHITASPDSVDERIRSFISLYADQSPRIRVMGDDPALHPDALVTLGARPGRVLVICEETGKKTAVSFNDIIQINLMAYYQHQQIKKTAFDGGGQITSAASYVTNDDGAAMYTLTGHQGPALSATVKDALKKSGMILSGLSLMMDSTIPQDCDLLVINNPQMDIGQDETTALTDHLKNGNYLLLLPGVTQNRPVNLSGLCSQYGMDIKNGLVADSASRHFYNNNPSHVIPEYDFSSGLLSGVDSKQAALVIQPLGMIVQEDLKDDLTVTPFLTIPDSGMLVNPATREKTEDTYVLAAVAIETINEEESTVSVLIVTTVSELTSDDTSTSSPNITNLTIFTNVASCKMPGVTTLSIPSKSLDITYNMVTSGGLWSTLFIIVIPVVSLITGFVVWMKHRKL